jgi:aminomethyltransferase
MSAVPQAAPQLLKTPLWDLHRARGGKMVPFAGYDMPVQYDGLGVLKEHLHTRAAAGLFDVSHMGQAFLHGVGVDPAALIEKIVPGDIQGLKKHQIRYSVLLNDQGGIIDDLMITRWNDTTLFLVVNAACKDKDFAYITQKLGAAARLEILPDRALLALQGPLAESVLAAHIPAAASLSFMTALDQNNIFVSRSGYTGEDGFEISVPAAQAVAWAEKLLSDDRVALIGLGARDSLRLEAGLCLYGHDIDDTTSPIEANLKWVIPKRRREEANFPGAIRIMNELNAGTPRLRVGIRPDGKAPMREGTELFDDAGRKIGVITSGGFGPTADTPVAMGYVETAFAAPGTKLNALLRGTARPVVVATLPFVKTNYKK